MISGEGPVLRSSSEQPGLRDQKKSSFPERNIRIKIEYAGTDFCGWQVQRGKEKKQSIQGAIEKSLRKVLQEKIKLIGSGRTDAGVHAFEQRANFITKSAIPLDKLQKAVNSLLPEEIVVTGIDEVFSSFHSRFDARTKTYRYIILNRSYPSAFLKDRVYFYAYPLNLRLMRGELKSLLGRHDFKAFCASGSKVKDTVRTVKNIVIKKTVPDIFTVCFGQRGGVPYMLAERDTGREKGNFIIIDIEADGFLYNMVRNIVGTLIEIGRGRFAKGSLKKILLSKDRKLAGPTAPARGLYLVKVKY